MNNNNRYVALEITSKIARLVIGFVLDGTVHILHALETDISGVSNGQIEDENSVSNAIKKLISEATEALSIKIDEVILCLPPISMTFVKNEVSTMIISPKKEIAQIDINNALNQLSKTQFSDSLEIVDIIPYQYILDTKEISIRPPLGKYSVSLLVKAMIYVMNKQVVNGYRKVLDKVGVKIRHFVVAPYASALYLEGMQSIPSSYYLLNIGAKISTFTLINSREIISKNDCFRFGGEDIVEEIQKAFSCPHSTACELLNRYGLDSGPKYKVEIVKDHQVDELKAVIEHSLNSSLIETLRRIITKWNNERYPLVISGGFAKLKGLESFIKQQLGLEVIDYRITTIGTRDKAYLNCLGIIKYGDVHLIDEDVDVMQNTISRIEDENSSLHVDFNFNDEL